MMVTAIICGCAENANKLHVKMDIKGMGDSIVVINVNNPDPLQRFSGKQGIFDFDIELKEAAMLILAEPSALSGDPRARHFSIPGMPGESVELTAVNDERYDINGSKFYAQYHEADLTIEKAQKPLADLVEKYMEMMKQGVSQDSIKKLYQAEEAPLKEAYNKTITDYIKAHAGEEAMAAVILVLEPGQIKDAVELLSPAVREGRAKSLYQAKIDEIEKQAQQDAISSKLQAAGREAPDFTLNDLNGKPLALSSLRGKYVVLDFWGSWCVWCIKGFPEMKNYYNKYKGKFEILGVDCNDTEEKWKDAVKKHELPWLHVYNTSDSKVLEDYGVQGFPTKIIIDPQGNIVQTIVGEDPAFYTQLDNLFGK